MDNNVSKNTFYYKFFKLHLGKNDLAISKLLKQQLLTAIAPYQKNRDILGKSSSYEGKTIDDKNRLAQLVASKIVLRNSSQQIPIKITYRCAIAFSLAQDEERSALTIAEDLVQFLLSNSNLISNSISLDFTVQVISPGWIDFNLSDRSLAVWLEKLVQYIKFQGTGNGDGAYRDSNGIRVTAPQQGTENRQEFFPLLSKAKASVKNWFFLVYVHSRCCSLLGLAAREGLIELKESNFRQPDWQIQQPITFSWLDGQNNLIFFRKSERRLLVLLSMVVEELFSAYSNKTDNLFIELGKETLNFVAECRIWGGVKETQPQLAEARLGLIAVVQWCLQKFLQEHLGIDAATSL
jgi:hypothetical protein